MKRRMYLIVDINNYEESELLSTRLTDALKKYCELPHGEMGKSSLVQIKDDMFFDLMTFDDDPGFDETHEKVKSILTQHMENQ